MCVPLQKNRISRVQRIFNSSIRNMSCNQIKSIRVKFISRSYQLPATIYDVPVICGPDKLSQIINELLLAKIPNDSSGNFPRRFDFYVTKDKTHLKSTLDDYLKKSKRSVETVLQLEFCVKANESGNPKKKQKRRVQLESTHIPPKKSKQQPQVTKQKMTESQPHRSKVVQEIEVFTTELSYFQKARDRIKILEKLKNFIDTQIKAEELNEKKENEEIVKLLDKYYPKKIKNSKYDGEKNKRKYVFICSGGNPCCASGRKYHGGASEKEVHKHILKVHLKMSDVGPEAISSIFHGQ